MAGDILLKYGTASTITITLASLASGSARQSTHVSNATTLYTDALVLVKVKTGDTGTASTDYVNVYAYGTVDEGTTWTEGGTSDPIDGTDGAVTLTSPTNLRLIGRINAVADASTYIGGPFSVANAFGGVLPKEWGIVIENQTSHHLDATEGSHAVQWQGVSGSYT